MTPSNFLIVVLLMNKCPDPDSNWRHEDLQSTALPTELSGLNKYYNTFQLK